MSDQSREENVLCHCTDHEVASLELILSRLHMQDNQCNPLEKLEIMNDCDEIIEKCATSDRSFHTMCDAVYYPKKQNHRKNDKVFNEKFQRGLAPKLENHSSNAQNTESTSSPALRGVADSFVFFKKGHENPHGIDNFSKLSDEIIMGIFKWLSKSVLIQCAQVCKRWKRLAYDESLWKRLDLGRKHLQPGVVGTVLDRGVMYLRLAMSEIKPPIFLSSNLRSDLSERWSRLQYLDLSMACISVPSLSELLQICSQLKKLSLELCEVNDEICRHIASNEELETLNMTMCQGLSVTGATTIATGCQKLVSWNLSWVHLSSEAITAISKNLPVAMKQLNLSGCRHTLTDECIKLIVSRCQSLVDLDISDAPLLTGVTIEYIVTHLTALEHLYANRCYGIAPAYYLRLKEIPSFRRLEIFGMPNGTVLQALRTSLPDFDINKDLFSTIARPTVGVRRTSIWGIKMC